MVAMRTPRSAARFRSTATCTSGFETLRPILTSVRLASFCPSTSALFEYSAICFRSGPRMLAEIANPPVPSPLPSAVRELMLGR